MAHGQALQRRATRMGGGSPDRGKCTIEVVVDGAADVEIRGENATLRNLSGQPPQWRRFECTSPMPVNPPNFRFSGVDGRGRQELVRAPQNGGMAVVRIQDSGGGSEGYTFDLTWGGGGNDRTFGGNPPPVEPGRRFTTDQAVRVCQDAVRQQAFDRFHTQNVAFRRTALDDNPGRRDYVTGLMDIRRGYDRDEVYRFSCSVNFDTGEVRSAQIDPADRDRDRPEAPPAPSPTRIAMDGCQRAVEDRIRNNGYQHVDIVSINVDDRPGRNDWIVGVARADIRSRSDSYNFSCSVNLRDGDVRSVDVRRR
ncbi:MAG TPA: hypothetical protein VG456_19730 [Candidatus Sulfopaludibacter sp.]|nr:hypothetical protein [Candidatus Sulfopaludibacter sp.]